MWKVGLLLVHGKLTWNLCWTCPRLAVCCDFFLSLVLEIQLRAQGKSFQAKRSYYASLWEFIVDTLNMQSSLQLESHKYKISPLKSFEKYFRSQSHTLIYTLTEKNLQSCRRNPNFFIISLLCWWCCCTRSIFTEQMLWWTTPRWRERCAKRQTTILGAPPDHLCRSSHTQRSRTSTFRKLCRCCGDECFKTIKQIGDEPTRCVYWVDIW